ncbi:hypothetical protein SAY87_016783 [Trapa incisa]|uniref:Uncharacterized protein n=1 Tax=Trapa incisa TaxID=236973 RepID=A0AAN7QVM0_9MYRT|nr:hypothetical protein SAY87_016783 [Trapa incisa]
MDVPAIGKFIMNRSNSFFAAIVMRLSSLTNSANDYKYENSSLFNSDVTEINLSGLKGKDGYSISPWPEEDGMDVGRVSPLEDLSLLDVEDPIKDQMSSNTRLDCEDFLDFEVESLDVYTPCIVDVDIEKENYEMNMKRVLRGHVSLKTGQKLMRLLIDNSTMLLKFTSKGQAWEL